MNAQSAEPLVSVILPVFNAQDYLVSCLESIINQTYQNWELIAVDDASSDASFFALQEYSKRDGRIKVFWNSENKGVGFTFDRGVSKAKGDFIVRMDADDVSYPERIAKEVKFLQENPDVVAIGGQADLIDIYGQKIGKKTFPTDSDELYKMLFYAIPMQQSSIMINKSKLPDDFSWGDGWKVAQDLHMYFKLVKYGKIANLEDHLIGYRIHPHGISQRNPKETFRATLRARKLGVLDYGYRPTLKGWMIHATQVLMVYLTPNFLIYPLYNFLRRFVVRDGLPDSVDQPILKDTGPRSVISLANFETGLTGPNNSSSDEESTNES